MTAFPTTQLQLYKWSHQYTGNPKFLEVKASLFVEADQTARFFSSCFTVLYYQQPAETHTQSRRRLMRCLALCASTTEDLLFQWNATWLIHRQRPSRWKSDNGNNPVGGFQFVFAFLKSEGTISHTHTPKCYLTLPVLSFPAMISQELRQNCQNAFN